MDARAATTRIIVNGENMDVESGSTVIDLIRHLKLRPELLAVEINRELLPRNRFDAASLANGDRIEIVEFVGGG